MPSFNPSRQTRRASPPTPSWWSSDSDRAIILLSNVSLNENNPLLDLLGAFQIQNYSPQNLDPENSTLTCFASKRAHDILSGVWLVLTELIMLPNQNPRFRKFLAKIDWLFWMKSPTLPCTNLSWCLTTILALPRWYFSETGEITLEKYEKYLIASRNMANWLEMFVVRENFDLFDYFDDRLI